MPDTLRAFIAIELNDGLRSQLAGIQSELKKSGSDVKWVSPENIHLTLKFLKEAPKEKIEKIKNALNETAKNQKPFEIHLSQIGAFPNIDFPRVIWAGIQGQALPLLVHNIEEGLAKLGLPKEGRPFFAHLTLGRARRTAAGQRLKENTEKINKTLRRPGLGALVDSITLFQSTLTPNGPIYNVLYKIKLADM